MNTIIRPERRRPISSGSLHEALRVGTQPLHGAVDALFSRFDLATRQGYGAFLGHRRLRSSRSNIASSRPTWMRCSPIGPSGGAAPR